MIITYIRSKIYDILKNFNFFVFSQLFDKFRKKLIETVTIKTVVKATIYR